MSVFQVQLNNIGQGQLDYNPHGATPRTGGIDTFGSQMSPSLQRTMFVTGPGRIYRELHDGQVFTDCNYWKRFAYPQVSLDQAFINVITDDGSVYSDNSTESTYPMVYNTTLGASSVYATGGNVTPAGVTPANTSGNTINILNDTGGSSASFVQISNISGSTITVRINGATNAVFSLAAASTQTFDIGDIAVSKIEFANTGSGAATTVVQVLVLVSSQCGTSPAIGPATIYGSQVTKPTY